MTLTQPEHHPNVVAAIVAARRDGLLLIDPAVGRSYYTLTCPRCPGSSFSFTPGVASRYAIGDKIEQFGAAHLHPDTDTLE